MRCAIKRHHHSLTGQLFPLGCAFRECSWNFFHACGHMIDGNLDLFRDDRPDRILLSVGQSALLFRVTTQSVILCIRVLVLIGVSFETSSDAGHIIIRSPAAVSRWKIFLPELAGTHFYSKEVDVLLISRSFTASTSLRLILHVFPSFPP